MCYSAGSISQAVNPCPMCKVYSHTKCPHIRETCRNRTAHPRMDVLYLKNAEVESFNGCGFCKWANQDPPPKQTGYNNPGWPGCCRPPYQNEVEKIPIADWHAVSIVHKVPIPSAIEDILNALSLPPLPFKSMTNKQPMSPTGSLRLSSKAPAPSKKVASSAAVNGNSPTSPATPGKSNGSSAKPANGTIGRGRQGTIVAGSNAASRSSSSHASTSAPNSPAFAENGHARRKSSAADKEYKRSGDGSHSNHSSPSRKSFEAENGGSKRVSSVKRPPLTPALASVSVSKVVASDTKDAKANDGTIGRRSSMSSNRPSSRSGGNFLVPQSMKVDDDCRSSSGSSDGMLSDSTMRSEGFTDYLSDESEDELQRQAEAKAAVEAQNQMEELEFKMARQQLAHVGLKPPKSWTETNAPSSPTKKHSPIPSPRSANIPTHSFAVAATAIMQTGQARG